MLQTVDLQPLSTRMFALSAHTRVHLVAGEGQLTSGIRCLALLANHHRNRAVVGVHGATYSLQDHTECARQYSYRRPALPRACF